MNQYSNFRKLSDALFGEILQAHCDDTKTQVAIKKLLISAVDSKKPLSGGTSLMEDVRFEVKVMEELNANGGHGNVMRLRKSFTSHNNKYLNLVLDYQSGGEVFNRVIDEGRFEESVAKRYFADCLGGLQHIHKCGYCHRDLSLENLLIGEHGQIVISDFGLAAKYCGEEVDRVGKGFYIAPEVFALDNSTHKSYDGQKADVWSLGVILFMMITGAPPTESPCSTDKRFRMIKNGKIATMVKGWRMGHLFSDDALDLITRMLTVNPEERITVAQIARHPWIEQAMASKAAAAAAAGSDSEPEEEPNEEVPETEECECALPKEAEKADSISSLSSLLSVVGCFEDYRSQLANAA